MLSTRVHDFSIEARKFQDETTYNVGGGPIAKAIAAGIANLSARESELGDWWAELPQKPTGQFGSKKFVWTQELGSGMCGKNCNCTTARTLLTERRCSLPGLSPPATGSSKIPRCFFRGLQAPVAFLQ